MRWLAGAGHRAAGRRLPPDRCAQPDRPRAVDGPPPRRSRRAGRARRRRGHRGQHAHRPRVRRPTPSLDGRGLPGGAGGHGRVAVEDRWAALRIGWLRATGVVGERIRGVRLATDLGASVPSQLLALQLLPHLAAMAEHRRRTLGAATARRVGADRRRAAHVGARPTGGQLGALASPPGPRRHAVRRARSAPRRARHARIGARPRRRRRPAPPVLRRSAPDPRRRGPRPPGRGLARRDEPIVAVARLMIDPAGRP